MSRPSKRRRNKRPTMRTHRALLLTTLLALTLVLPVHGEPVQGKPAAAADAPKVVTLGSPAPLINVKVMVKGGSAADPQGLEGLAHLTGRMLVEGGFGDPKNPVTKDKLAEITRPWGGGAYPEVDVTKETTVISMTVPKEVLGTYVQQVLRPLFTQPQFAPAELDRIRAHALTFLRSGRLEQIELLGLIALDNVIHEGTSYAQPDIGTEKGLDAVNAEAVRRFYATFYRPENMVVGVSSTDPVIVSQVQAALADGGNLEG